MAKLTAKETALDTWLGLNAFLKKANEEDCLDLLRRERAGKNRKQFVKRIHHRYNKVRAQRERREMGVK